VDLDRPRRAFVGPVSRPAAAPERTKANKDRRRPALLPLVPALRPAAGREQTKTKMVLRVVAAAQRGALAAVLAAAERRGAVAAELGAEAG
jgi:hypothetical protein